MATVSSFAKSASTRLASLLGISTQVADSLVSESLETLGLQNTSDVSATSARWANDEQKIEALLEVAVSAHFARGACDDSSSGENLATMGESNVSSDGGAAESSVSRDGKVYPRQDMSCSTSSTASKPAEKEASTSPSPLRQKTLGSYFAMPSQSLVKTQRTITSLVSRQKRNAEEERKELGVITIDDEHDMPEVKRNKGSMEGTESSNDAFEQSTESESDKPPHKGGREEEGEGPTDRNIQSNDDFERSNESEVDKPPHKDGRDEKDEEDVIPTDRNIPVNYFQSGDFDAKELADAYAASGKPSPPFLHLANALAAVCSTTKRLEKERILTNLLLALLYFDRAKGVRKDETKPKEKALFPESCVLHATLLAGNVACSGLVLNIGHSAISQALCLALSCSSTRLRQKASAAGEMGDAAADIFLGRDEGPSSEGNRKQQSRLTWGARPKRLLTVDIINSIESLHKMGKGGGGKGVEAKRKDVLYKIFAAAQHHEELRFAVKIFCEHIRTGATLITVLRCLSAAHVLHTRGLRNADWQCTVKASKGNGKEDRHSSMQGSLSRDFDALKEAVSNAQEQFRAIYARHHDLKACVFSLVSEGFDGLARCDVEVGVPVQPMLASPSRGVDEVVGHYLEHFGLVGENCKQGSASETVGRPFVTAEYKYDGQRAQIHCRRNSLGSSVEVTIFSRHLDDMTAKFAQLASWFRAKLPTTSDLRSFILDAEIVAVKRKADTSEVVLLPFQVLSTMRRDASRGGGDIAAAANAAADRPEGVVDVCVFAFDILSADGKSLVDLTLQERRDVLRNMLSPILEPGYFELAKSIDVTFRRESTQEGDNAATAAATATSAASEIQSFLSEAIGPTGRCEGLMLKSLLSRYSSHESREKSGGYGGWRKLKKDYVDSLADSIDAVPIGAWRGNGRKAGWYSPFLLAVLEPSTGEFQSLCRVMSGFSDEFYRDRYEFYSKRVVDDMPDVVSTDERPPYWFEPAEVWEIRGADLTLSPVHHAARGLVDGALTGGGDELLDDDDLDGGCRGISLRFPRFVRVRTDKSVEDATTAQQVLSLFAAQSQRQH